MWMITVCIVVSVVTSAVVTKILATKDNRINSMKVIKIRQQTKHCTDTTRCPTICAEH